MKKSSIWLLAIVMFVAFFSLLFLQVSYIKTSMALRTDQFNEMVKRSLVNVSRELEHEQTRQFLEEDMIDSERVYSQYLHFSNSYNNIISQHSSLVLTDPSGLSGIEQLGQGKSIASQIKHSNIFNASKIEDNTISKTSYDLQQSLSRRYLYEQGLLNEVILKLLYKASDEPILKRIRINNLEKYIRSELLNNALNVTFCFQIIDYNNKVVFSSPGFSERDNKALYTQILFPNDPPSKLNKLRVYFPGKKDYVYSELSFFVPTLLFTVILLITFLFTVANLFRQKRLSEMKTDFINNMTHELKTPVSTISLASQMLKDVSVTKSPEVFQNVANVINDEAERLGLQVEKVLQMSLFDKQKTVLKLKELDINDIVVNVANTHHINVKKYNGELDIDLQAEKTRVEIDEMHFKNVLFNLLENALKYRKENVPPILMVRTWNEGNKVLIAVEDNGIGMKKEYSKKIFDRFFRVPTGNVHDVKGFGLGLAYVKKIVEDLNGTIRADSELNIGTKFIISLPTKTDK